MKVSVINCVLAILFFVVYANGQSGNTDYKEVTRSEFEKINEGSELNNKSWRLVPRKRDKKKKEPEVEKEYTKPKEQSSVGFSGVVDVIAYFVIIVLIILLVYLILSNVKVNPKVEKEIDLEQIEHIEEVDVVTGYQTAVGEQNYRLAIRMQFIKLLQYLNEHGMIKWKNEKTNREYKREIVKPELREAFTNLSSIYERSWYGNKEVDEAAFLEVDAIYQSFFNKVGR